MANESLTDAERLGRKLGCNVASPAPCPLRVDNPQAGKALDRLRQASLRYQPAGALRNRQQQHQECKGRNRRHRQLPAPELSPTDELGHGEIADICQQDADHDVDLKQAHQRTTPRRRGDLRDVDRREHRGGTNGHSGQKPERDERGQAPAERTADRGHSVQQPYQPQHRASAELIPRPPRANRPEQRPPQCRRDSKAECGGRQPKRVAQCVGDAGNNSRVESEQQTGQACDDDDAKLCPREHCFPLARVLTDLALQHGPASFINQINMIY